MSRSRITGLLVSILMLVSFGTPAFADDAAVNTSSTDNYALLLGGAGQGFQSASTTNYLAGVSNFTVEAWLNPSDTMTSGTGTIFAKTDTFQYMIQSGTYTAVFNGSGGGWKSPITTGVVARINEWQHVAYVKSGNTFSLYLNGALAYQVVDATNVPTTLNNPTSYASIGSNPWNGTINQSSPYTQLFSGGIDEVRIWNVARAQSDIQANMNVKVSPSASNLVGYWDFNGTSSTATINDRTGNLNFTTFGAPSPTFPDIKSIVTTRGFSTVTFPRTYLNGTGGYTIPSGQTTANVLVVGGGGSGGFDGGGGGGGGGVYQNSALPVTSGATISVIVGTGGAAINGYTGGSLPCNGAWSTTVIACQGSAGGTSKFGSASASGGGGGGGIEASGTNDSDSTTLSRGGGGGAGGQNSRVGNASPGVGAFSGGSVSDGSNNSGAGGGSSVASALNVTSSTPGNGAQGVAATLNSIVYGSGGAGGSFSSATQATGGSGAANGGTTTLAPTSPANYRGGGGAGGGNGNPTATNAYGTTGGDGVIIVQYSLIGTAVLSTPVAPIYRTASPVTATTNVAGKVTFYANGKRIPGCIQISTVSLVATCSWKPSVHAAVQISATVTPADTNYLTNSVSTLVAPTSARAIKR